MNQLNQSLQSHAQQIIDESRNGPKDPFRSSVRAVFTTGYNATMMVNDIVVLGRFETSKLRMRGEFDLMEDALDLEQERIEKALSRALRNKQLVDAHASQGVAV
jgi:hypothetical protein